MKQKLQFSLLLSFICVLLFNCFAFSNSKEDTSAVYQAALDYIEGWYTADGTRIERAIHSKLSKCRVTSATALQPVTFSDLIQKTNDGYGSTPLSQRVIDYNLLNLTNNKASVFLGSKNFFDILHLVKCDTIWKILNVVWDYHGAANSGNLEGLEKSALDYINSIYSGNDTLLSTLFHPGAVIRRIISQQEVDETTVNWLIEQTKNGRWSSIPKDSLQINVQVLRMHQDCASVKITSYGDIEYLQMCFRGNKWLIVKILWERVSTKTGVHFNDNKKNNPTRFYLFQNYPNPFNPTTTVRYSIQNTGPALIKIHNLLGQELQVLVNEIHPAGQHQVQFDASKFPSGIYLYSLRSGHYSVTKKMILLR